MRLGDGLLGARTSGVDLRLRPRLGRLDLGTRPGNGISCGILLDHWRRGDDRRCDGRLRCRITDDDLRLDFAFTELHVAARVLDRVRRNGDGIAGRNVRRGGVERGDGRDRKRQSGKSPEQR